MKMLYDLVVLDLEANGKNVNLDPDFRITEVGAVILEHETLEYKKTSFSQLVDGRPLEQISIDITHITPEMLEGQPHWDVVGKQFYEWVKDNTKEHMICAWGTHFDVCALRREYGRISWKYPLLGRSLCMKSIAFQFCWQRGMGVRNCGVQSTLKRLGYEFEGNPHRAKDDAWNTARIYRIMSGIEPTGPKAQAKAGRMLGANGKVLVDTVNDPDYKENEEGV